MLILRFILKFIVNTVCVTSQPVIINMILFVVEILFGVKDSNCFCGLFFFPFFGGFCLINIE